MSDPLVLGQTSRWLVLDKPAGWLTIPGSPSAPAGPVLSSWARDRFGPLWVVHRIDRETSGVVLFARSAEDHRQANEWFQRHSLKKTYECLASGSALVPTFRIRKPIQDSPSLTQVEVLENFEEGFLGRILLASGRRHQIRIHLSQEGHPLWGDPRYGGPRSVSLGGQTLEISRVALHAARLELPTKEVFEAAWPADFAAWVAALRERGKHV